MTLVTIETKVTNSARTVNPSLRDIIYRSMYRLNIYSIRETPQDNEVNACISEFNSMLQGWYLQDVIVNYTEYALDDTPSFDIGTTDPLYYDDCFVDNLCLRLIELYNLDSRSFGLIANRARLSLDRLINLRRDKALSINQFKSDFDNTLKNTPDINRVYNATTTG